MKYTLTFAALMASFAVNAQTIDNWMASGKPVTNSTGLCWRDASWTPATAHPDCDGAIKPVAKPVAVVVEAPKQVAKPVQPKPAPAVAKVSYNADTFFDFDKAIIKPAGKQALDSLLSLASTVNIEVVIVVGHTDSTGSDSYNMKLGQRRAEAVRAYLVSKGIESKRIYAESKGERQPVADNKTKEGRAKNRRVEIEVVGQPK